MMYNIECAFVYKKKISPIEPAQLSRIGDTSTGTLRGLAATANDTPEFN